MVICVKQSDNEALHMAAVQTRKIRGIEEVEADDLAIRRSCGLHAGLIASGTIVSDEKSLAVEVKHRNHVLRVTVSGDKFAH